ncbi:nicotinate (nicotinamide) nucleotide adenylyltransferase [Hydrogenobacter hydrogenophilus]|uniref:Probable nicotinate-nucleotide adenylyltransferase n=1 Tax=Hydrogenobacter hydrogenophilus TaxID=35835 RepID=A0A285NYN7_9AQUI|nr:nicotinate (nicotinamide) nucleotide adenylyltransferase [Hydrogenobacter hydrogenophilus]SNZ14595.1 nicotinate-nucleotide adenylyltransferase [Hydrogenobacter hydrogenophilus]
MFKVFFGGSFDPVHIGHLIVARDVLEQLQAESIVFLPAFQSPLKEPHVATPQERLEMLSLAVEQEKGFEVSSLEIERRGVSYTVDTAQELFHTLGERPTFLVGADSVMTLHLWKDPQRLTKMAKFVIADRYAKAKEVRSYMSSTFPNLKEGEDYIILSTRNIDISSTEIRNRIREGRSIKWLVPEKVENYILQKSIYIRER